MRTPEADLRRTVERLSAFPTRHAASPYARGAAEWIADEMSAIPNLRVERMRFALPAGPRVPVETEVEQILGWIEGTEPGIIGVGAHLDTINMADPRSLDLSAPGANDDASGIAAMLHAARRWAENPPAKTGLFVAFTAEEQGLVGAKHLAERMRREDWPLGAFLNLDMIANTGAAAMPTNDREIRLYSDENSRELARFAAHLQAAANGLPIKLVLRPDRIRRGGDHTPLAQAGYRAVRFTEPIERYKVQHTPFDTIEHVDLPFLARVAEAIAHIATTLGDAIAPPKNVRAERNGQGTTLTWEAEPPGPMMVYWRDTRSASWTDHLLLDGPTVSLPVNLDDNLFAVGDANGIPVPAAT